MPPARMRSAAVKGEISEEITAVKDNKVNKLTPKIITIMNKNLELAYECLKAKRANNKLAREIRKIKAPMTISSDCGML